jgi:hypothetical protein
MCKTVPTAPTSVGRKPGTYVCFLSLVIIGGIWQDGPTIKSTPQGTAPQSVCTFFLGGQGFDSAWCLAFTHAATLRVSTHSTGHSHGP